MRASAVVITTANIGRVTQLVNKTNQFNLTTRRYTDSQIHAWPLIRQGGASVPARRSLW